MYKVLARKRIRLVEELSEGSSTATSERLQTYCKEEYGVILRWGDEETVACNGADRSIE